MIQIEFKLDAPLTVQAVADVFRESGIERPQDGDCIRRMIDHANLTVSAWTGDELIGLARTLTDFCHSAFLCDMAVKKAFQKQQIGRQLIEITKLQLQPTCTLTLLSPPSAAPYYYKAGFEKADNAFVLHPCRKSD